MQTYIIVLAAVLLLMFFTYAMIRVGARSDFPMTDDIVPVKDDEIIELNRD